MADLCTDNRFELIEKYKQMLIDATNIEEDPQEMAVIDNILFRFWQMGWLDRLDAVPVIRCGVCRRKRYCSFYRETNDENGFCDWAERREE